MASGSARFWKYVAMVAAVALANFGAGRLGLLFAIPPGYSTPVFPPSGIALGAMLLIGLRVAPGVFLGSFLLNFDQLMTVESWLVSASIALGSTLQAAMGVLLIRRVVGFPTPLDDERSIIRFFALGGPISCLISATWGNVTLVLAGRIVNAFGFNWFNWWVGDTIGVLIFTPSLLILFGEPRRVWRSRRLSVGAPLAVAFAVAVSIFLFASNKERSNVERQFELRAETLTKSLQREIDAHVETLWFLRSYLTTGTVSRKDFQTYVHRTLSENPNQSVSWNPRVRAADRESFEADGRRTVGEDFKVREYLKPGVLVSAGEREEYVVVKFIEPFETNKNAIGYDVASDPTRSTALLRARDSGKPTATAPLELVQGETGVLVFMPVYNTESALESVDQRRDAIRGYAVNVIRIDDLVARSIRSGGDNEVRVRIYDDGESGASLLSLYDEGAAPEDGMRRTLECMVAGRTWQLEYHATGRFQTELSWQAWLVLAGGLSFTSLLCFVLLSTTGRSNRVQQLVERRTEELVHEQELLLELIQLQDRERRMVAQDIHDGFVQEIVGAHMLVESAKDRLDDRSRKQMSQASDFLQRGIGEARRLIGDLRPMVIEELGIVEAVKHLIADQEKQHELTVALVHDVQTDRLDPTLEGVIFRIVQEALRNIIHHADSRHAVVRLEQDGDMLVIEIRDQGKGFDLEAVPASRFGVRGIRERARIFGGQASIQSAPGEGTVVHVELPILVQPSSPRGSEKQS